MLKNNPIIYLASKGWEYAGRFRPAMVLYLVLFACSQAVSLAEPYVIGRLLNTVQENAAHGASVDRLMHDVYFYLTLFFLIQFGFWAFHGPGRVIEMQVQYHIKARYKSHLFQMVTDLPMKWHREHHSGDSIDKINRASNSLALFLEEGFQITYMLFRFIGTQIILFWFMPFAGWATTATTAVALTIILVLDRVLYKNYLTLNRFDNKVASAVHDYVTNIVSVITLRLENSVLREVKARLTAAFSLYRRNNIVNEIKWFCTTMLIGMMIVAVLLWYVHSTLDAGKVVLSGTFFTLFEYLRRIGESFYNFAYIYGTVVRQSADVRGADPLLAAHAGIDSRPNNFRLPANWKQLQIRNLYFTYEDEKHRTHHLAEVGLDLMRGQYIAFVGESGSGKSTLLNLIRGVQRPDRAQVFCDGKEVSGGLSAIGHHTTLMPQDPEIFADTIRFNISFGLTVNEDELLDAIRLARFEPVLARLPLALETNISEKGVNLSGGEKQRLALARGIHFAMESDIVLLDEPTSSVDTFNERIIYEQLLARFKDKCVVSSVHKLHLLEMFDFIYVLDDGRIVEQGTFKELMRQPGVLSSMWKNYQPVETILVSDAKAMDVF